MDDSDDTRYPDALVVHEIDRAIFSFRGELYEFERITDAEAAYGR